MKIILTLMLGAGLFVFLGGEARAQKKTVILIRHAEKDLSPEQNSSDPELSAAGKERAQRLPKAIKKYRPYAIYSSNYKRTRATAAPLAEKYKIEAQIYDPRKLNDIAASVKDSKARRIVVVGHNTTTPQLINLLIGEQKFKELLETEYDKIFVLKFKNGQLKRIELLEY
ncbi:MAG TPA: phosphoglycerate mutase family protein [Pyrinomonadaceae bacterium]|jgi:broad specificity phosphatase PhoE|nr:phosphoglycerate mutase family protein [Pyrinomonadaceae bacterium]